MTDDARKAMEAWLSKSCPHDVLADGLRADSDAESGCGLICYDCLADLFARLEKVRRHNTRLHAENARLREALERIKLVREWSRAREIARAATEDTDGE